jgi:YHS domain-containing protein
MKSRWFLTVLTVAALAWTGVLIAAEKEEKPKEFEATCPVSGGPALEKAVLETKQGLKVYFCCDKCPKAFKEHPEKFSKQVGQQLVETGQIVQVACAVCGKSTDAAHAEHKAELGHAEVAFCCEKCKAEFAKADDEKKMEIAFGDLKKAFTRQTKCPVSGKPINPTAMLDHDGHKVYFCCPNCPKAFAANPEKYKDKLPQLTDENEGLPPAEKEKS